MRIMFSYNLENNNNLQIKKNYNYLVIHINIYFFTKW